MTEQKYDLHCHSNFSDGALSPTDVVLRAIEHGVTTLALTDHDTVTGLFEAQQVASQHALNLVPGIELSCIWNKKTFHILGLNIDPKNTELLAGTQQLQKIRMERAKKIASKLEKNKIPGAFDAVQEAAGTGMITRPHFANYLINKGHVSTMQEAFDRYLGQGKSAFVNTQWVELEHAIQWIKSAGGVAVLAHPMRYKLTASWMRRFLSAFKEMGGLGIEVITARSNLDEIRRTVHFARQYELYGSVGSDFHTPKNQWVELGRLAPLPTNIKPVWELFNH
ncbi:phosphatase [Methylococcaceae bacterium CS1]|nr:phosphatase [Methylococcaceae bacterium CS4]TXK95745.1 phosphatase [Methylococcaceae bacterium CS5]TXL04599.1 phosphatase [Methylococcaceae bacterium CS3]TXL04601.1 phosphatase [Methylococcaceae bacterium CS2]TXL04624.1 phosphatase [Methylococcaceae bacterium CS1]